MNKKKSKIQMALEFYDSTPGDHPKRAAKLFGLDSCVVMQALHARRLGWLNRCVTCGHKVPKGWKKRQFVYHARVILGPSRRYKQLKKQHPRQAKQATPSSSLLRAPDLV